MSVVLRPAVFLDRDNTLIEDPGYTDHPDKVRLLDGAAEALVQLREAGFATIVVTNQSGVARGLFTEDDLDRVHERMRKLLQAGGADVDAIYYCPFLDGPETVVEAYRRDSDLRKPRPGMLLMAAEEHGLDLTRSWMIGDSQRDMEAGLAAGCRTIRIGGQAEAGELAEFVAPSLPAAVEYIVERAGHSMKQGQPSAPVAEKPSAGTGRRSFAENEGPQATVQPASDPVVAETLRQILDELRTLRRERQYEDFSIAKLAAAVIQAFALCAMAWGIYGWAASGPDVDPDAATAATIRLLAGIALQLLALTCFTVAQRK